MELLLLVTPNFNLTATVGFIDPFRAANYLDGRAHFRWRFASIDGGDCLASNGMTVHTEPLPAVRDDAKDLVMVSSSWAPEMYNSRPLHSALRRWARQGAILGGLDTGAFILAQAGLLAGRRATVHYEHIDAMNELFPAVETCEDLFVFDDNRITCCGGVAAVDCALHIIKSTHGDRLANGAARYIYHQSLRPPGTNQVPAPVEPLGSTVPQVVKQAIKVMEENLEEPVSIPQISARSKVSQRHLDRLFAQYVKKTPALYYRDIRLDRARGLVTQTDMPLSEVALASGFSSHVHFSRAYRQRFGLAPKTDRVEGRIPFEFRAWPMHRKGS
ncbi:MAG: GlxA family transcriptional regulator [Hyphomicrobiales bacterium]|nr:GlxA family transcriptional regulator [Hyphomicrobiales bacterium]